MIARLDLLQPPAQVTTSTRSGSDLGPLTGWLLLTSLTLLLVGWFALRWLARPAWLVALPLSAREGLFLLESAGAFTMAFLWTGLWWRWHWRNVDTPELPLAHPVDTIDELFALHPGAFERYVAGLFRYKGYQVTVRGRSGDHGVDLELIGPAGKRGIVQCKRYQHTVGEKVVRDLFGTLLHERAAHAFLVTTADISPAAYAWATGKPITLIDGPTLVQIAAVVSEELGCSEQPSSYSRDIHG